MGHLNGIHYAQLARADSLIAEKLGRNDDARTCDIYCEAFCTTKDQKAYLMVSLSAHFLPDEMNFMAWDKLHALSLSQEPMSFVDKFKVVENRQVMTQRTTPLDALSMSICSFFCDFAPDCIS
jgi:hypothetical protein